MGRRSRCAHCVQPTARPSTASPAVAGREATAAETRSETGGPKSVVATWRPRAGRTRAAASAQAGHSRRAVVGAVPLTSVAAGVAVGGS